MIEQKNTFKRNKADKMIYTPANDTKIVKKRIPQKFEMKLSVGSQKSSKVVIIIFQ